MVTPLSLFAGGRAGDFIVLAGTAVDDTGGFFDPTYSDCALNMSAGAVVKGQFLNASLAPTTVVAGHRCDVVGIINETRFGQIVAGGVFTLYDSSDHPWMRVNSPSNGSIQLQCNTGTGASPVWTNFGSAVTCGLGGTMNMAIQIDAGGAHTVLFAYNGTAVFSGAFNNAGLTNLAYFTIFNTDPGGGMYITQVMAAQDMGLVGALLKTIRATGAGTYSAWTGAYTDVNEAVLNLSTYNVVNSAAAKQSYPQTHVTVPANYAIATVWYYLWTRNDGGASPQHVQALIRSGGSDTISSNLPGIAGAYLCLPYRYDVDPNTAAAWTQAGVNAIELGYVSAV